MSDTAPPSKANLARIRDNQRRSRARRKEYLQELEGKYRNCELLGVEASTEIQTAARRVADENKRLRALLREKGIDDREVDEFVAQGNNQKAKNDGEVLEEILRTRKPCNGDSSCTRDSSEGSIAWEVPQVPNNQGLSVLQPLEVVHPVGPITTNTVDIAPAPIPQHFAPSQGLDSHLVASVPTDSQYPPLNTVPQNYSFAGEVGPDQNTSSCAFAAEIITSMADGISTDEVRKQLGCNAAMDCNVNNALLFNVMDGFSEQGIGLDG